VRNSLGKEERKHVKILIADDAEETRIPLKKTLEDRGYCVEAARNGEDALSMAQSSPPELILSEVLMPEMDGFLFCGKIKSSPDLNKIPFIFYTATPLDPKEERLAFGLGASRCIEKSLEPSAVLKIIQELIQENQEEALAIPEAPKISNAALFKMYEASISRKLQNKVSELRLYKSIFNHSKDAIAIVDLEGYYLEQNSAHRALIGYSDEALSGKTPAIHLGESAFSVIIKALSEEAFYRGELVSRAHSGQKISLELSAFPVYDQRGQISAYVGIKRDISQRKRVESLASEQRKVLEMISGGKASQSMIFEAITCAAEAHAPGVRSSILVLEGRKLRHGAAPSLPEAYNRAIDGMEIGPAAGSCGTASFRKVRVIVSDVLTDPLWADFCHLGEEFAFRSCWSEPIIGAKGNVLGTFALYHDVPGKPSSAEIHLIESMSHLAGITIERKQAESHIKTLSQAIEQSPVAVMLTDTEAKIEYVNSAFEKVSGYLASEVLGQNPRLLKSGNTPKNRYKDLWQALTEGKSWQGEFQNRKKNGDIFWEQACIAPVLDEAGLTQHYLAVKEDITLRKRQEELLIRQAHFDALTGLPNRFLSLDRLSQLLKEARRSKAFVAVLFLDLDDFKKVNDTLGHEVGDRLLIEAAERLRRVSRRDDTIGRLGGDEFIILLAGLTEPADARPVVKHFIDQFTAPFKIGGRELILTASVGISVFPGDGENASALLRCADSAMYHAKALGRNTYAYYTESMNRKVSRRLVLEEQMFGALKRGEFSVFYQPMVHVSNGKILGAEALIRWQESGLRPGFSVRADPHRRTHRDDCRAREVRFDDGVEDLRATSRSA